MQQPDIAIQVLAEELKAAHIAKAQVTAQLQLTLAENETLKRRIAELEKQNEAR